MKRINFPDSSLNFCARIMTVSVILLLTSLSSIRLSAEDKKVVSGVVTSLSTGEPLVGVAVYVAGTMSSAYTDADGKFSLSFVPKKDMRISFRFLGMISEDIVYTGQKVINLQMKDDSQKLEDVVVTGYGNIRKSGFTGNTTKVTKDDLLKVSPKNVIASIQVFDPSFRISEDINMGSNPNAMPEFYVRGQTSVKMDLSTNTADISRQNLTQNNNLPIFILDGFEVGVEKIYDMDPSRISSMTLLKDAAATALYGSRAANGVVVIETRAPEEGKLRIAYNMTSSLEVPDLSDYNLMTSREKLDAEVAAGYYSLKDPDKSDFENLNDYLNYLKKYDNVVRGVNTYWLGMPVRNSLHHKHGLYIDGGSRDLRWAAELTYNGVDGVMKGSGRNTYGAGLTLDYRIGKFQILDRVYYDVMHSREIPNQEFSRYAHLQPYATFKDPVTGKYLKMLDSFGDGDTPINPLYENEYMKSFSRNSYNDFSNKLSINFFATEAFTAKVQFSLNRKYSQDNKFIDPSSTTFERTSEPRYMGTLNTRSGESFSYNFNALLLYNKSIGKNYINVTGGMELNESNLYNLSSIYSGFPSGSAHSINNAMQIMSKPVRSSNKTRLASFLVMANYSYDDIYLLDASMRLDGSSEFGEKHKTAPFWAVGTGINVHNYGFLKGNKILSRLKLRATYGQLGKVNFPVYAAKSSYVSTSVMHWYISGMGNIMKYLGNDSLTWEKTNSIDAGFDLGMFSDRLMLRFTYYDKKTKDMITSVTLPSSSGFTSYMDNIGKVQNKGLELDLRCNVLRSDKYDLTIFGNMSHNENRILEISEALKTYNKLVEKQYKDYGTDKKDLKYSKTHSKYVEGGSTTSIFAVRSLGIDPATGKELFLRPNGEVTYDWKAEDMAIAGNTEPLAQGSFGFNARWGQFSAFASFIYRFGGEQYNYTLVNYVEDVNMLKTNADRRVGEVRWKKPGDLVPFKSISSTGYVTRPTSRFVQKDNVVQFNSLSISYDFDPRILHKAHISMLRLTAGMEDLAYWSTIRRERGLYYPYSRTFNLGVNITF